MKQFWLLILCFIFLSCNSQHLSDAEKIFGHSLSGKVEYLKKNEKWNDFNGNGYKVEIYNILDLDYIREKSQNNGFKSFDFNAKKNPLSNTDYSRYIENGVGFYKTVWLEDKIKTIVIDTVNNKLLYYYSFL